MEASRLLMRFLDPTLVAQRMDFVQELRPRAEDYAAVFTPDVADSIRGAYGAVWQSPPLWRIRPDQTYLRVSAATAEELGRGGGQAQAFPGGYREIAPFLSPGRVWVCWEFLAPGALAGISYDGLVPLEGRWAWFPKPWRALPKTKQKAVSHWSE